MSAPTLGVADMAKQAKHTAGPWFVDRRGGDINAIDILASGGGVPIANVCVEKELSAEDRANARLIAAAPDLLAALKHIRSMHCTREGYYQDKIGAMHQARLAIEKATQP